MTLQEAISVLTIHQQWRMGEEIPMLEPKRITEAINIILDNHLHNQLEEISDEKIKQAAKNYDRINTIWGANVVFIDAVKWYRESLKNKL